jgi:hypothetical protein
MFINEIFLPRIDYTQVVRNGLNDNAILAARYVRDLPYDRDEKARPKSLADELRLIQQQKRGTCSGKHYLLGRILEREGFPVVYLTYPFLWADIYVDYPQELAKLAKKMPPQNHLSLGSLRDAQNPTDVKPLDVSWDPLLSYMGFPVASLIYTPDQPPQTSFAVLPLDEPKLHYSAQERWKHISEVRDKIPRDDVVPQFYNLLFLWLRNVRMNRKEMVHL